MQKVVDILIGELRGIRSNVLSPAVFDAVRHNNQPLKHLAFISKYNQSINIEVFNPADTYFICNTLKSQNFDAYVYAKTTIRINILPPSGEERIRINKYIKSLGERAKISIRNIRQKLQKTDISSKELNKLTSEYNQKIDKLVQQKQR